MDVKKKLRRVPQMVWGPASALATSAAVDTVGRRCQVEPQVAEWTDDDRAAQLPWIPISPCQRDRSGNSLNIGTLLTSRLSTPTFFGYIRVSQRA